MPVLLFLGTKDQIVGDADFAKKTGEGFQNIRIVVLESGHLIGVEKREEVNKEVERFLNLR